MSTATAQAKQKLDSARGARAWMEVETRGISIVPILRGLLWMASMDVYGEKHNKTRAVNSLSASASTCLGAVESLLAKLEQDGESQSTVGK